MRVFGNPDCKDYVYIDVTDPHNTTGRCGKPLTIVIDHKNYSDGHFVICSGQKSGPWDPRTENLRSVWKVDGALVAKALTKVLWKMKNGAKIVKKGKPSGKKKRAVLKKKR